MDNYSLQFAELFLRCFAGILFFFQGYDKFFRIGIPGVVKTFHNEAESHHVPDTAVWAISVFSTFVELFGGMLLIIGLFNTWALVLLGTDLVLISFAFSFMKPMWDMKHVFPRFILVILLLICPADWEKFSLDHFFFTK